MPVFSAFNFKRSRYATCVENQKLWCYVNEKSFGDDFRIAPANPFYVALFRKFDFKLKIAK